MSTFIRKTLTLALARIVLLLVEPIVTSIYSSHEGFPIETRKHFV